MGWPSKRPGGDLVAGNLTACVQSVRGNELLYVGGLHWWRTRSKARSK